MDVKSAHHSHLLQIDPLQHERVADDGECDKVIVAYQLCCHEHGQCIYEQLTSLFELVDGDEVEAMVDFEVVVSVPVATFFHESMM